MAPPGRFARSRTAALRYHVLTNALDDPTVLDGWRIELDGAYPEARGEDFEYANRLE